MPHERQPSSPSRIPRFSQTAPTVVAKAASPNAQQEFGCSKEAVRELLDELITAVVLQVPETAVPDALQPEVGKSSRPDDGSRASAAGRSAITALKEGIDARCDELFSIETLDALDSAPDDLVLTLPQHVAGQDLTLQDLADLSCSTEFAAASLEVDGPPDSWLRASGDLSTMPSTSQHSSLQLSFLGPSWEDYLTGMSQRLPSSSSTNTIPGVAPGAVPALLQPAAPAPAALQVPAGVAPGRADHNHTDRAEPVQVLAAAGAYPAVLHTSPSSSSIRVTPISPTAGNRAAAGSRSSRASGSPLAGRPGSPSAARCRPGSPSAAKSPMRCSPHGSPRANARAAMLSPRSAGSTSILPAPFCAGTTTAVLTQQQQQQQLLQQEDGPLTHATTGSISAADQPFYSRQEQQQQHGQAPGTSPSPTAAAGLDVILVGHRTRSSSSSSNGGSRQCSLTGDSLNGPRDEATSAWMSSLRIAVPSSSGNKRTPSRSQSLNTGTPPLSSRSSARLPHSRSARLPALGLDAAGEATTPPATVRSSKCSRITPRSVSSLTNSVDGVGASSSRHAHLSLRPSRAGSSRSASVSPRAAASRASLTTPVSPVAAATPLPLSAAAAAAAQGTAAGQVPAAAEGPATTPLPASETLVSQSEAWQPTLGAAGPQVLPAVAGAHVLPAIAGAHVLPAVASAHVLPAVAGAHVLPVVAGLQILPAVAGLRSCGGDSELLLSDQEIMADPTAVKLFMELNEEIEAEGRAAMAAAAAQAAVAAADGGAAAAAADTAVTSGVPCAAEPVSSVQGCDNVQALPLQGSELQLLPPAQLQQQLADVQSPAVGAEAIGGLVGQSASPCGGSASVASKVSSGNAAAPSTPAADVARPESKAGAGDDATSAACSSGGLAALEAACAEPDKPAAGDGLLGPVGAAAVDAGGDLQVESPQQPSYGCRCVIM